MLSPGSLMLLHMAINCACPCRQALKEYSDWPTHPQLYIATGLIGGIDDVLKTAAAAELQQLLKDNEVHSNSSNKQQQQQATATAATTERWVLGLCCAGFIGAHDT